LIAIRHPRGRRSIGRLVSVPLMLPQMGPVQTHALLLRRFACYMKLMMRKSLVAAAMGAVALVAAGPASADRYRNPTAIFAGLDKITGRIIAFEVAVNETVQFGALQLTPKVCYSRPVTEKPQTTTFIEVEEITFNNESKKLFSGWMFAASPGLNAIEHPVYDIWLTGCKGATERDLIKTPPEEEEVIPTPTAENALARPLGADGRVQPDAGERAAQDRRRQQQINRSTTSGPILPGQPLNTAPPPPQQAQRPAQRFFPITGSGVGGQNPGIYVNPGAN
jgi:hypothetical protein